MLDDLTQEKLGWRTTKRSTSIVYFSDHENFRYRCKRYKRFPVYLFEKMLHFIEFAKVLSVKFLLKSQFAKLKFRDFCDFGPFSRKFLLNKKINQKFAKVFFTKNQLFCSFLVSFLLFVLFY